MGYGHGVAFFKEVIGLTTLGAIYLFLKVVATLLSLWFSARRFYRWYKRRNKRKPTAKG